MAIAVVAKTKPHRTDSRLFISSSQQHMPVVVSPKRVEPNSLRERDFDSQGCLLSY